jgi:hypothetical protein
LRGLLPEPAPTLLPEDEAAEATRCAQFLRDCDPVAADALSG